MKTIRFYIILGVIMISAVCFVCPSKAQDILFEKITSSDFNVSLEPVTEDNPIIQTFKVNRRGEAVLGEAYTLVYFIDEVPVSTLKNITLPYLLKINTKGLLKGAHILRINVMDGASKVGTAQIRIEVH